VTVGSQSALPTGGALEPGSFRDRTARVFRIGGDIYRGLTPSAWDEWQFVSRAPFFQHALNHGWIVKTEPVDPGVIGQADPDGHWHAVLRHERVPFISYPYEWCFGMLKDAALLQLELLTEALSDGVILKDATPYNVQWKGTAPVFIDVASFVRWRTGEPWAGYQQFCQLQLYPLFLQAYKGVSFQPWLRGRIEGIPTEEMARLMSWRDWLRPGILTQVVAQNRLQHRFASDAPKIKHRLKEAGFQKGIIVAAVQRLRKLVDGLEWKPERSTWVDYSTCNTYDELSARMKESFVEQRLAACRGGMVWDLGCNTGRFSKIAAKYADLVIALDSDHASIECLYRELKAEGVRNVIPLFGNLADLSPARGWRGVERQAFVDRGRPRVVLCLAVVHHLAITANIPIHDLVRWLNGLAADLIIEFPLPHDPMVQHLLNARNQKYDDYTLDCFESSLSAYFEIRERLVLSSGSRVIYHATPKA
jgi:hypothetical protein